MEKVYTFTKSALIKKVTIVGSIIFVAVGILSFFQGPIAYAIDLEVDSGYLFKSDVFAGILLILSGLVCAFTLLKAQTKLPLVLKIVGIFYVVLGLSGIGHGNSYNNLFGLFSIDLVASWFYLVVGILVAAFGFFCKNSSSVIADVKKEV